MQDRYVGDIGDYGKLGLLRSLAAAGLRIGVNWYRTPDENHNEDGKFIQYLRTSGEGSYRAHDPLLWDELAEIVNSGRRQVESLEAPSILDAAFFHDILDFSQVSYRERENVRADWHQRALERLRDCGIVFADPDNGLIVSSALRGKGGTNMCFRRSCLPTINRVRASFIISTRRAARTVFIQTSTTNCCRTSG